ncbi:hypothetical protein R6Q57_021955 [Mikania cordata]
MNMKNRGKSVKLEQDNSNSINLFPDSNYCSSPSGFRCRKHPSSSSSVGCCAYCLTEKLINLVCSDCGEQRISLCSCSGSNVPSYRNSSSTVDVGSIGRISFLIENETDGNGDDQKSMISQKKLKQREPEGVVLFKRSNSCVVKVKKNNGFWKFAKLFKKKREKEGFISSDSNRFVLDQRSDECVIDVSRTRSLSSFMGDKFHHEIHAFGESDRSNSGIKVGLMDFERGFSVNEVDISRLDDDNDDDDFIDLKIDLFDKSKTEYSIFKKYDKLDLTVGGSNCNDSSSCRIAVNDREIKKVKNTCMKALKLSFKDHYENNGHDHILKS